MGVNRTFQKKLEAQNSVAIMAKAEVISWDSVIEKFKGGH